MKFDVADGAGSCGYAVELGTESANGRATPSTQARTRHRIAHSPPSRCACAQSINSGKVR